MELIEDEGQMGLPPQIQGEFAIHEPPSHSSGVSPWISMAIAAIGAVIAICSSVIFVGGSLRQVEIDSRRLDQIEAHGSPQIPLLTQQVQTLDQRIERIASWVRDFPKTDLEHAVALAAIKAEIADLQVVKVDVANRVVDLQQRSARIEQIVNLMDARVTRGETRMEHDEADIAVMRAGRQLIPPR